ncbi:MAG: hypothetical protein O6846_01830 [Thaumarchaeota archaeon]|nr:hypothetical protein [Nitrososphaerota archaeon]
MRLERPTAMLLVGIIGVGIGIGGGYFGFRFQNIEGELREARLSSQDFEELQSSVEGLVMERDSLAMRVQELVGEVEDLNANATQSTDRNRLLESRISILESQLEEIPALIAQLDDREFQLFEKEQIIDELNRMVENLNEEVDDLERELANVLRKEGRPVPDPGFSLLFEESFEYVDSISNNGWIPVSVAGTEETQSFVTSDQNNALRLDDNDSEVGFEFHHAIDLIERDFRVDYYVRIGTFSDELGMDLRGSEGIADGVRGISTGFDGANFVVQNRIYFVYDRDQWYHIRLDVNMTENSMDVFVDDMEIPLDSDLSFTDVYYDRLIIRTSAVGIGVSFWDGIRIQTPDPVQEAFSPEGTVVFGDSFEYSDAPGNHGWVMAQGVGSLQTQRGVSIDGSRALQFSDTSENNPLEISHTFPQLSGDFQVDYFLRSSDFQLNVQLLLDDGLGEVPGNGRGIATELTDHPSRSFRVQNTFTDAKYNLDQWYHVRLVVRPVEHSFDVYLDDMSEPLIVGIGFEVDFFNRVRILTGTAGTGLGYWDGIVIQDLSSNSTSLDGTEPESKIASMGIPDNYVFRGGLLSIWVAAGNWRTDINQVELTDYDLVLYPDW